jgi:hypothetical protein
VIDTDLLSKHCGLFANTFSNGLVSIGWYSLAVADTNWALALRQNNTPHYSEALGGTIDLYLLNQGVACSNPIATANKNHRGTAIFFCALKRLKVFLTYCQLAGTQRRQLAKTNPPRYLDSHWQSRSQSGGASSRMTRKRGRSMAIPFLSPCYAVKKRPSISAKLSTFHIYCNYFCYRMLFPWGNKYSFC